MSDIENFEDLELYDGPVVFLDGVHYPCADEEVGGADLSRPLRWVTGKTYRLAKEGEPKHNDIHHQQFADVGRII